MPLPENDEMFNTKGKMLQDITTLLGGRVAEELIFNDITTGASNDIKRATGTARAMVMQYGLRRAEYAGQRHDLLVHCNRHKVKRPSPSFRNNDGEGRSF